MRTLITNPKCRWFTSLLFFMLALASLFFALSNRSGQVAAAPLVTPTLLHFNGNPPEDVGCTGNGSTDVVLDTCADLRETAALSGGPAARWVAQAEVSQNALDRSEVDPNWIWVLSSPKTLSGPMTINWWQTCNAECVLVGADWRISLWADGVNVFETHVFNTPATANVPSLLSATITVPTLTANTKWVLKIDPNFAPLRGNARFQRLVAGS